jgi:hypothetical protein
VVWVGRVKQSFISYAQALVLQGLQETITVKVGTIFEDSVIGMGKWMIAVHQQLFRSHSGYTTRRSCSNQPECSRRMNGNPSSPFLEGWAPEMAAGYSINLGTRTLAQIRANTAATGEV